MKYAYYPRLILHITSEIRKIFPNIRMKKGQENMPAHILWMMRVLQEFDDPAKRGRWIGWVIARAEMLGLLTNRQSRELVRQDVVANQA